MSYLKKMILQERRLHFISWKISAWEKDRKAVGHFSGKFFVKTDITDICSEQCLLLLLVISKSSQRS